VAETLEQDIGVARLKKGCEEELLDEALLLAGIKANAASKAEGG